MVALSSPPDPGTPMSTPMLPLLPRSAAALVPAALLLLPVTVLAAEPAGKDADASSWGLGFAAISVQKPYAGMERETKALPMLQYENRWVRVFGPGVELKLPSLELGGTQQIDFRLVAKFDGSGYEAKDAAILNGMAERKGGFWAGAKASWRHDIAQLSAEWTADASSHSKGQRLDLKLEKSWRLGRQLMFSPRLGVSWQDKKYVDYYFGVRGTEAQAGRVAYAGQAALNTELGLRSVYMFDPRHSMFLDLGVSRLAKEIKDSPLVDRSTENRVFVGYLYRF